jgi:hypothetical protein
MPEAEQLQRDIHTLTESIKLNRINMQQYGQFWTRCSSADLRVGLKILPSP